MRLPNAYWPVKAGNNLGGPIYFMKNKKVIRCQSPTHRGLQGNILIAVSGSTIFAKCNDRDCHRWTRITINIPGVNINLSEAGIVQESLPEGYHLDLEPATTVVGVKP
jgi:hypothetical protein